MREQLGCLAGLGRGELAERAGELMKGWDRRWRVGKSGYTD